MAEPVASFPFDPRSHLAPRGFRGLWRMLRGWRLRYLGAMLALAVSTVARTSVYLLLRAFIDQVVGRQPARMYAAVAGAFVLLALLQGAGSYLGGRLSAQTAEGIAQRLRNHLYHQLQSLAFSYHDRMNTGELIQRSTGDVDAVRQFYGTQAVEVGRVLLLFCVNFTAIASIDTTLALVSVAVMPVLVAVSALFFRSIASVYERFQEREARLSTTLQENLTGVRVVKAFAREGFEREKFDEDNREKFRWGKRLVFRHATFWPLTDLLSGLQLLAGFVCGSLLAVAGRITLGGYLAYVGLVSWLIWPMRMLGRLVVDASKANVSFGRVMDIVGEEPEPMDAGEAPHPGEVRGEVVFRNVSFHYRPASGEANVPALEGIDLEVPAGSVVALLGPTGSGKSTLVNLLPRFYEYSSGSITLDGRELSGLSRQFLRSIIAGVEQQPFLFSLNVAENIAYGVDRQVSREEVEEAARAAAIHEDIMGFPEGYDTLVGEKGVTLSGGQKQRVAIARALLRDPRILILDDATSSVDMETEGLIWEALQRLMRGRTAFIIAHRIQTLMRADLVCVLDRGRLVERGTHEELMRGGGIYRRVYDMQARIEVELAEELENV